jgi:hypothetical protein
VPTLGAQYKLMGALFEPVHINHTIPSNHTRRIIYCTARRWGGGHVIRAQNSVPNFSSCCVRCRAICFIWLTRGDANSCTKQKNKTKTNSVASVTTEKLCRLVELSIYFLGLRFDSEDEGSVFLRKSLSFYQTTWRHLLEDGTVLSHRCENFK